MSFFDALAAEPWRFDWLATMRRLERDGLILSKWEQQSIADAEQRPLRKYYKLTRSGETTLEAMHNRYPLLKKMISDPEVKNA